MEYKSKHAMFTMVSFWLMDLLFTYWDNITWSSEHLYKLPVFFNLHHLKVLLYYKITDGFLYRIFLQ